MTRFIIILTITFLSSISHCQKLYFPIKVLNSDQSCILLKLVGIAQNDTIVEEYMLKANSDIPVGAFLNCVFYYYPNGIKQRRGKRTCLVMEKHFVAKFKDKYPPYDSPAIIVGLLFFVLIFI